MRKIIVAVLIAGSASFGASTAQAWCAVNTGQCGSGGHCYVNTGTCDDGGSCYINTSHCGDRQSDLITI